MHRGFSSGRGEAIDLMNDFSIVSLKIFGKKGGGSGIEIKGCHFHFAKCLFKRVISAGLKNYYSNSKKARKRRIENSSTEKSKETGEEFATFLRAAIGTVPKMFTKC